jgi:hypothetical protein
MNATEAEIDHLEQQIPSLSAAAVEIAYNQALAAGVEVLVSGSFGGSFGLYQVSSDGSRKLVKKADYEPLHVPAEKRVITIP